MSNLRTRILSLVLAAATVVFSGTGARAQGADSSRAAAAPAASRALCFRGQPLAACRRYVVFEFTAARHVAGTTHAPSGCVVGCGQVDLGGYLAWDVGEMKNVDSTHAFGASAQIGGADPGGVRVALQARGRIWLPHRMTFDAAAGPLMAQQDPGDTRGVRNDFGVTANAAVGFADLVSIVGGVDAISGVDHTASAAYVGGRLGAHAGVLGSVVVGILAIGVVIALSHGLQ